MEVQAPPEGIKAGPGATETPELGMEPQRIKDDCQLASRSCQSMSPDPLHANSISEPDSTHAGPQSTIAACLDQKAVPKTGSKPKQMARAWLEAEAIKLLAKGRGALLDLPRLDPIWPPSVSNTSVMLSPIHQPAQACKRDKPYLGLPGTVNQLYSSIPKMSEPPAETLAAGASPRIIGDRAKGKSMPQTAATLEWLLAQHPAQQDLLSNLPLYKLLAGDLAPQHLAVPQYVAHPAKGRAEDAVEQRSKLGTDKEGMAESQAYSTVLERGFGNCQLATSLGQVAQRAKQSAEEEDGKVITRSQADALSVVNTRRPEQHGSEFVDNLVSHLLSRTQAGQIYNQQSAQCKQALAQSPFDDLCQVAQGSSS